MQRLLYLVCFAIILSPLAAWAEAGDAEKGARVFRKCAACHVATEPKNKLGPHLVDIINRPVGFVESYKYSKAMTAFSVGDKVWDEQNLREFLAAPKAVVRGSRMAFIGLKKKQDIDDILAYFLSLQAE